MCAFVCARHRHDHGPSKNGNQSTARPIQIDFFHIAAARDRNVDAVEHVHQCQTGKFPSIASIAISVLMLCVFWFSSCFSISSTTNWALTTRMSNRNTKPISWHTLVSLHKFQMCFSIGSTFSWIWGTWRRHTRHWITCAPVRFNSHSLRLCAFQWKFNASNRVEHHHRGDCVYGDCRLGNGQLSRLAGRIFLGDDGIDRRIEQ